jgi:hypothetical protein
MATKRFEEEEDVALPTRKKSVPDEEDEAPAPKRKSVAADEDEPPTPKRRSVPVDEDEVPTPKRRSAPADEDEAPAKPKKKGSDEDDAPRGIDVDFGDERVTKRPGRLERLVLDGAKAVRFALIPGFKVRAGYNHYVEGQGTFVCNSTEDKEADCCKKLGNPGMRAVALVIHYTNAKSKDGTMPKNEEIEWEVKYLRMSRTNFAEISKKKMEDETVYDFDLVMSEKENGIGFQFEKISKTAWWRADEELEAQVLAAAEKFRDGKALSYQLGKKIDDIEYKAMIRKAAKAASKEDEEEI